MGEGRADDGRAGPARETVPGHKRVTAQYDSAFGQMERNAAGRVAGDLDHARPTGHIQRCSPEQVTDPDDGGRAESSGSRQVQGHSQGGRSPQQVADQVSLGPGVAGRPERGRERRSVAFVDPYRGAGFAADPLGEADVVEVT